MAVRCAVSKASPLAAAVTSVLGRFDNVQVVEGDAFNVTTAEGVQLPGLQAALSVVGAGFAHPALLGKDARERAHINQWVGMAVDVAAGSADLAEAELVMPMGATTVAGTEGATVADALLYAAVAPGALAAPKAYPKLNKWMTGAAKLDVVAPVAATVKMADPAAGAAAAERGKGGKAGGGQKWAKPTEEEIAAKRAAKEKEKAEKERLKAEKAAAAAAAGPAAAPELNPTALDLRVGLITKIEKHPKADRLFVESIDLGEEGGPRTIVSGLVQHYNAEDLLNRKVVVVANMKPKPLVGTPSHGMVLCASVDTEVDGEKKTSLELVPLPDAAGVGERISIGGDLAPELPPVTKKMTELLAPLCTDAEGNVVWNEKKLAVASGPLVSRITNADVR